MRFLGRREGCPCWAHPPPLQALIPPLRIPISLAPTHAIRLPSGLGVLVAGVGGEGCGEKTPLSPRLASKSRTSISQALKSRLIFFVVASARRCSRPRGARRRAPMLPPPIYMYMYVCMCVQIYMKINIICTPPPPSPSTAIPTRPAARVPGNAGSSLAIWGIFSLRR